MTTRTTDTGTDTGTAEPLDLVGVGLGPFNLSTAALADAVPGLATAFFDAKPRFAWHPGLLLDGTTLQVPFLADLVTLVDPTSRWSFLNYLREHDRLFPFYFTERFHVPRREYDAYCRWVAESLPSCRFGSRVVEVDADERTGLFTVTVDGPDGRRTVHARNVVLGLGSEPSLPASLRPFAGRGVVSSAEYLSRRDALLEARHVTVVGSGQSGAEVVLDLLQASRRPDGRVEGPALTWVTRTAAFAPMEYSKLGLEHFTPDYTRYFAGLPEATRRRLVGSQWQLYKAASGETLGEVFDALYDRELAPEPAPPVILLPGTEVTSARPAAQGLELALRHAETALGVELATDAVVAATGYRPVAPTLLDPLAERVLDGAGTVPVDGNARAVADLGIPGGLYVQNGDLAQHGVGTPDLGLSAHRSAVILNDLRRRAGAPEPYRLPARTAFTTFGVPREGRIGAASDLGGVA